MAAGPYSCWAFTPTLNTSLCLLSLVYSVYMYWYIKCCPPSHKAQFIIIPLCMISIFTPASFFFLAFIFLLSPPCSDLLSSLWLFHFSSYIFIWFYVPGMMYIIFYFLRHEHLLPLVLQKWSPVVLWTWLWWLLWSVILCYTQHLHTFEVLPALSVSCAQAALFCLSVWLITVVESCTFQSSGGTNSGSSSPAWTLLLARWLYCLCIFEALSALL